MRPTAGDVETIAGALKAVARGGMPASDAVLGDALVDLFGVVARSVHPDERVSRADAFNALVPRLIESIEPDFDRAAARILFGIEPGTAGTTLTARRARAARVGDYDPDHFRKRLEPKIIREVAVRLHKDSLRYKSRARRAPAALEPTGDSPRLTEDDLTAQEEHVSRIWAELYALRAELIAAGRKSADPAYAAQVEEHRQAARAREGRLQELIRQYVDTYGDRLIRHGDNEYDAAGLRRLLDWSLG